MNSSLRAPRTRGAEVQRFFAKYLKTKYDLNYDLDKFFLSILNLIRHPIFKLILIGNHTPPENIPMNIEEYDKYLSNYFDRNPNEKRRFDDNIVKFKKEEEIFKEKEEINKERIKNLKKYLIKRYEFEDDKLLNILAINIVQKYEYFSNIDPKYRDIVVFLNDPKIKLEIDPLIQEQQRIRALKKQQETLKQPEETLKEFDSITTKKPSETKLHKIAEEMISDEEQKLNVKITQANDKLKELSGLDNDEIESVINDVMIIIKQNINNKKEELKLKEQIIQYLNPVQTETKDLIDFSD